MVLILLLFASVASAQSLGSVLRDGIVIGGKQPSGTATPAATAGAYRDPSGFRLALPAGWKVENGDRGHVSVLAPDRSQFVMITPVVPRAADCAAILRGALPRWPAFPAVSALNIAPAGNGIAVANFRFRQTQSQGSVLCAETGRNSAMLFSIAAPAAQFDQSRARLVSILRSFRYEAANAPAPTAAPAPAIALEPWREQSEGAFEAQKPAGWRAEGGVTRLNNNDVRVGHRLTSPDQSAAMIIGDVRMNKCLVPGQSNFGVQQPMQGTDWCPYRSGGQVAELYASRALAADWRIEGLRITGRRARPDLADPANQRLASLGARGYSYSYGEVSFEGTRGGQPVTGVILGETLFLDSPDRSLMGGNYTQMVWGFWSTPARAGSVSGALGRVLGSMRWNPQWVTGNRGAAQRDHQATMRVLEEQRQLGQKMFEERMAAADRRAEAVGDLVSGTVRLTDGKGNFYRARAGSNYYFRDEEDHAVVGTDVWSRDGNVNLTPLEVVR